MKTPVTMNRNGDRSGSLQLVQSNESRRKSRPCAGIDYIIKKKKKRENTTWKASAQTVFTPIMWKSVQWRSFIR